VSPQLTRARTVLSLRSSDCFHNSVRAAARYPLADLYSVCALAPPASGPRAAAAPGPKAFATPRRLSLAADASSRFSLISLVRAVRRASLRAASPRALASPRLRREATPSSALSLMRVPLSSVFNFSSLTYFSLISLTSRQASFLAPASPRATRVAADALQHRSCLQKVRAERVTCCRRPSGTPPAVWLPQRQSPFLHFVPLPLAHHMQLMSCRSWITTPAGAEL
jgi:hypothetical protein